MSHKLCQPDMRNISHVCILYMTLDIITMLSFRDSPFNNCLQATATHLIVHGALKLLGAEAITIFMRNTKYNHYRDGCFSTSTAMTRVLFVHFSYFISWWVEFLMKKSKITALFLCVSVASFTISPHIWPKP